MQYTVYKSGDASAPTLNGTTGSLITVLDAILVNGYGSKAAAGWAKAYSGTSKAAYRAAANNGNRRYLRVQDDGPGAATFQEARITGYDSMTDVDTGVNAFPNATQGVGSVAMLVVRKSATANSTARSWIAFASPRAIIMFIQSEGTSTYISDWAFGDFYSVKQVASTANTIIIGRTQENSASGTVSRLDQLAAMNAQLTGHYTAYTYTGGAGSTNVGKACSLIGPTGAHSFIISIGGGGLTYPNPADGGLYLEQCWVHETNVRVGKLTGVWGMCHGFSVVADQSTFSGAGDLSGKTFIVITPTSNGAAVVIETSDTLDYN